MSVYAVTGAAGFIGSSVAELLASEGHTVIAIDNLNTAYDVRLKHWRLERLLRCRRIQFHTADICDFRAIDEIFRGAGDISGVINLAARAGVRYSCIDPWVYVQTNIAGTLTLLEMCRRHGIQKFVLASTSSVYGSSNATPYLESARTDRPASQYAASKSAAEAMCHSYHHLYGLDVSVLRYFSVFSPAGRPDMSPFRFVQWIREDRPVTVYGDGEQARDFTYVDDIARGTVAALASISWGVFNLGGSRPITLNEMIGVIEEAFHCRARINRQPPHPADPQCTFADHQLASEQFGWTPQVQFEEGMGRLVAWYESNREWARDITTNV